MKTGREKVRRIPGTKKTTTSIDMSSDSDEDTFFNSFNAEIERRIQVKRKPSFKDLQLVEKVVEPRLFSRQEEAFLITRISQETRPRYIDAVNKTRSSKVKTSVRTDLEIYLPNEETENKEIEYEVDERFESPNTPRSKCSSRRSAEGKNKTLSKKRSSVTTEDLAALVSSLRLEKLDQKR